MLFIFAGKANYIHLLTLKSIFIMGKDQALDRCKDLVKYFINNYMPHDKAYQTEFTVGSYTFHMDYFNNSRNDKRFILEIAEYTPILTEPCAVKVWEFCYLTKDKELRDVAYGSVDKALEAMEDLVLCQLMVLDPLLLMITERVKGDYESMDVINVTHDQWMGDIVVTSSLWSFNANYGVKPTTGNIPRIIILAPNKRSGPFPIISLSGPLKVMLDTVPDWVSAELAVKEPNVL